MAGGYQLNTAGHGDLIFPTIDNNIEILHGAIHMPGQIHCILSTAQLEKQGFSIRWPAEYRDVELIRPDGSICGKFQRMSGRLIYRLQLNWNDTQLTYTRKAPKRAYYLSLEFLMGRTLDNAVPTLHHFSHERSTDTAPASQPRSQRPIH